MNIRIRIALLIIAVTLVAWISVGLILSKGRHPFPVGIRVEREVVGAGSHEAIVSALERRCPLSEFATIVTAHPESRDFGLLLAASWGMTNYARMLLQQAADPKAYTQSLTEKGDSGTLALIQWVADDSKHSTSNNAVEPSRALSGAGSL